MYMYKRDIFQPKTIVDQKSIPSSQRMNLKMKRVHQQSTACSQKKKLQIAKPLGLLLKVVATVIKGRYQELKKN